MHQNEKQGLFWLINYLSKWSCPNCVLQEGCFFNLIDSNALITIKPFLCSTFYAKWRFVHLVFCYIFEIEQSK